MQILLIGATGQLGRELLRSLPAHGPVAAAARSGVGKRGVRQADLTNFDQLRALVREVRPEIIINAAAYTAVDAAETDIEAARAANELGPAVLADEAARLGFPLVHYSTDYVFDGSGETAWHEDDPIAPLNVYGQTKAAGEAAIRASGAAHLILRTSWVYGLGGRNFVNKMFALRERDELPVVADQWGAPTSTPFLAEVTSRLLSRARQNPAFFAEHGGTLHVVCGGRTSWHGLATEIFSQLAGIEPVLHTPRVRPVASSDFPAPARRPRNCQLSTNRLVSEFNITPPAWETELNRNLVELYSEYTGSLPQQAQSGRETS